MATTEHLTVHLHGMYHDVLRDAAGRVLWDRGWNRNTIVRNCRRLLAGFMAGPSTSVGIQGLRVGQGSDAWDLSSPPQPAPTQTALVDPNPFLVPRGSLQIDFLDDGAIVTATPTNRLQIVATLGPNVPPWPDANHASGNLREFGLVGRLNNVETLINYITHPVIVKDPASTLTRTIWLVF
ncbi:MAG TPA: hypothetical protein VFC19_12920 [Candidatus Limnocylindrales bacterium]|jgi:hypothetical protein|nr:hypothetical protein [Candidatus Limnocylindrales bacterium]